MAANGQDKVSLVLTFVLKHLARVRDGQPRRPLFAAIQGCQGCGKSYLAEELYRKLSAPPHKLRVAQLSLDDLYLPHEALARLAASNPDNKLLSGRGQPGTHDIELGRRVLAQLRAEAGRVSLPVYNKSAFAGEGDRSLDTVDVDCPLDVVVFEGWMTGFLPLSSSALSERHAALPSSSYARTHSLESLQQVNELLRAYADELWPAFDCMIQLRPLEASYTWAWRQEHAMKAKNGGKGMTDDQVKAFVDRYAPAYELWDFADRERDERQPWQDHLLTLTLDLQRNIV